MQRYYEKHSLSEFGERLDSAHQLSRIMKELGLNIIKHYDSFVKCRDIDSSVTYGSLDCKDSLANLKTSKNPLYHS